MNALCALYDCVPWGGYLTILTLYIHWPLPHRHIHIQHGQTCMSVWVVHRGAVQWWMQLQHSVTMAFSKGQLGLSWIEQNIVAMSMP